jgi:uncharacterized protein YdhG (YjbR/CyaY superfamily)
MDRRRFKNVDEYISELPLQKKRMLSQLRKAIKQVAPSAEEIISYNMPAYKQNGILVYFAAHSNHIGFYPFTTAIKVFSNELSKYETSRGTVKFPLDKKLPVGLIKKITKFRVNENIQKAKAKKLKRK